METLSLKDRARFRHISWLMPEVDVKGALMRLGLGIEHSAGNEVRAFCPDHHVFTGRASSHANWTVNVRTGETFCFTEGRGSNLVFTVCRALDCGARDAVAFLTGKSGDLDFGSMSMLAFKNRAMQMRGDADEERPAVKGLDAIAAEMGKRYMSEEAYRFFVHPPWKKHPTNITPETVDRYWVFERTWGFYANRVVIPFVMGGFVVGFCALDFLGKEKWMLGHPTKPEDEYRKVRYPMNFVSGNCLFGYDDCQGGAEVLVVTEGPREVMKLWQEGFPNAVAILGSYLGDKQLELLTSLNPKRVALMFDGDDAGLATTERIASKLERNFTGESVMKCFVPRGKDPKNLGKEDFEALLEGR